MYIRWRDNVNDNAMNDILERLCDELLAHTKSWKRHMIIIIIIAAFTSSANAQIDKAIATVDEAFHNCVANYKNDLLDCSHEYYDRLDSLLNLVYKQERAKLTSLGKDQLRKSQLAWLKRRDQFFQTVDDEYWELDKKGEAGTATRANAIMGKAEFVRKRVLALTKASDNYPRLKE
jgi:uncharacterized protein YecT (DUF1311 family)